MQRMHDTGVTNPMVAEEYRMHPYIPKMVQPLVYNSQPIDILFVLLRDRDRACQRLYHSPNPEYNTQSLSQSAVFFAGGVWECGEVSSSRPYHSHDHLHE